MFKIPTISAERLPGLLPPLTFESPQVAIAGLLEPAYDVAGDSIDYAVDPGVARIAFVGDSTTLGWGVGHPHSGIPCPTLLTVVEDDRR